MEIFKDIPNYEGIYQVSNKGRVKSLKFNKQKILKNQLDDKGYCCIILWRDSKIKKYPVHQLVAMAFLDHKPDGLKNVVDHINFNRTDNNIDNLQIITARENSNRKHLPSTSKYTGVCWHKGDKKWHSRITINGSQLYLGSFNNEEDASKAYQNKLKSILNENNYK